MSNRLPLAPADDLFSDDFITAQDIAVRDARRNCGRPVVRVEAPVAVEVAPVVHRCTRCHRVLKSAESVARGTGRTCERKVKAVLAYIGASFTARQIEAATEVIADGGLVVGPANWTCLVVSSDGRTTYVVDTATATCTCKAGQYGRPCYHLAAALAVTI
jgi:hypothetical protein